jgi:hypothetical protein
MILSEEYRVESNATSTPRALAFMHSRPIGVAALKPGQVTTYQLYALFVTMQLLFILISTGGNGVASFVFARRRQRSRAGHGRHSARNHNTMAVVRTGKCCASAATSRQSATQHAAVAVVCHSCGERVASGVFRLCWSIDGVATSCTSTHDAGNYNMHLNNLKHITSTTIHTTTDSINGER